MVEEITRPLVYTWSFLSMATMDFYVILNFSYISRFRPTPLEHGNYMELLANIGSTMGGCESCDTAEYALRAQITANLQDQMPSCEKPLHTTYSVLKYMMY